MVATVSIQELNGETLTYTELTSARYCTNDLVTPGTTYSIPIPTADFNYSFWKHHVLAISGAFTRVDNIRWYCDGAVGWNCGTSGKLFIGYRASGDIGCPLTDYYQASGTIGTTGLLMISGHQYYMQTSSGITMATSSIVGNPFIIDSDAHEVAGKSKAVVTQVSVDDDATHGTQTQETVTFRYDEV
jgi:hypothetical protein